MERAHEAPLLDDFFSFDLPKSLWKLSCRARGVLGPLLVLAVLGSGGGCPARPPANAIPPLELTASADPKAEADFRAASEARQAQRLDEAYQRFRAFLDVWPNDPLVPFARLELGRIDLARGKPADARRWFDGVAKTSDPALAERGRLYGAVAAEHMGDHAYALSVLRPLVGRTVEPEETRLVLDTLASAEEAVGDELSALDTRDRELSLDLRDDLRSAVETRVRELVAALDPALELPRAYETLTRTGYAWPVVARRLLFVSHERGDRARVQSIASDLDAQGISLDDELRALVLRAERSNDADPNVIGAILPLTGRAREVGEAALHGLMLASSTESSAPRPRIVYRDDMGDPARALEALEDLASVHRVIAVVGPVSNVVAKEVAPRARELGVPLITLSPDASITEGATNVYRLFPDAREEAAALVRHARNTGARGFVLLHPEGTFGEAIRAAFEAAISAQKGVLVGDVPYATASTSFVREAESVAKLSFDALILADSPGRIALLAPALASQGIWSSGEAKSDQRVALFLVPALGFDPSLARTARRYLQGAVFSVPFDATRAPEFVASYRSTFDDEPNVYAAVAYDAYRILEAGLGAGARTRDTLATALGKVRAQGVLGASDGFSPTHGPRRAARLETLTGDAFIELP